ncbi:MAG TPA: hypothetical protein VKC57_10190, partial [Ktedonobacterales bacterium]|nr:hypothetical protein [Ktedonobacterales bacterium]
MGNDFAYPEGFETARLTRLGLLRWNGTCWDVLFGNLKPGRLTWSGKRRLRFHRKEEMREEEMPPMSVEINRVTHVPDCTPLS